MPKKSQIKEYCEVFDYVFDSTNFLFELVQCNYAYMGVLEVILNISRVQRQI